MSKINSFLLVVLLVIVGINAYAQKKIDVENYKIEVRYKEKKHHVKLTLINGQKVKGIIKSIDHYTLQLTHLRYKKSRDAQQTASM